MYNHVLKYNIAGLQYPHGTGANNNFQMWSNRASAVCGGGMFSPSTHTSLKDNSTNCTDMIDSSNPIRLRNRCSFKIYIRLQFEKYFLISSHRLIVVRNTHCQSGSTPAEGRAAAVDRHDPDSQAKPLLHVHCRARIGTLSSFTFVYP